MPLVRARLALAMGLALTACLTAGLPTRAADATYRLTRRVRLGVPGVTHVFDTASGRLYTAAASFPRGIFVTNTAQAETSDRLGETPFGPIDVAPDRHELFILSPTEGRIRIVNLSTRRIARTLTAPVGDAVFYEPSRQDLYVLGTDHRTITVLGLRDGRPLGTMKLSGEPSFIIADAVTHAIYVRLIDQGAVQVIDPTERAVTATWKVDTFRGSTMAVDPSAHRLFVTAADNVLMLDTRTGEQLAKLDLGYHVLGLTCDPETGTIMASTPTGLAVIRADAAALTRVQHVSVGMDATFLFFDPRSHSVFAVGFEAARLEESGPLASGSSTLMTFERR